MNGFRHFDDYEFGCRSISEAENLLAMLQEQLSEYELDVNPKKTDIIKLPVPLESIWTSDLRNFRIRRTAASQRYDLIEYFGRAFEYYRSEPEDHVLRYAVSKLRDINIDPSNLDLYNDLLIQCMMVEAGCIRFVFEQFLRFQRAGYSIAVVKLQEAFNDIISRNAPLGHGSEVAWALWGAILFDISIDDSVANTLSEMMDSVVALLALDAQNRGLINQTTSFTKWESVMTSDELYAEQWLLCYEANVKGWLPSLEGGDHVATDPNFGFLKANGVSFYDTGMVDVSRSSPARLSSRDDSIISGY